jgi:carbon storage regulator CsrA
MTHVTGGFAMLVLSRKCQESVVVGGSDGFAHVLKVTVVEIKGGTVRLGFEIDVTVPVHRAEVCGSEATPPASRFLRRIV